MNETKPTAKAAKTVVSAWPAASGSIRRRTAPGPRRGAARRRCSARRSRLARRRRRRARAGASAAAAPPAARRSPATTATGTHQTARLKPLSCGLARMPGPYVRSSSARICCLVRPRAMSLRIATRSWSARSDSAMFSGTLHVSHITSSSTSLNDARGGAASAAPGPARATPAARPRRRASARLRPVDGPRQEVL